MNGKLLKEYDVILEKLEKVDWATKEMVFNLMNVEDANEIELVLMMDDKQLKSYLEIDHYQLSLNKKLYDECCKNNIDSIKIEKLLDDGADPLGIYSVNKTSNNSVYFDYVLQELMGDIEGENIVIITELCFKHGLATELLSRKEQFNYDDYWNPLEDIRYYDGEINVAFKLIDVCMKYNTNVELMDDLISLLYSDISMIGSGTERVVAYIKMLLYLASFKELLNQSAALRDYVEIRNNKYDISLFKNIDNYNVIFDSSTNTNNYNNLGGTVVVLEKETGKSVWKIILNNDPIVEWLWIEKTPFLSDTLGKSPFLSNTRT